MPTDDDTATRPPAHLEDEAELEAEDDDDLDDDEVEEFFTILLDEALWDRL
jgi:hypothetical protein